MKTVYIMAPNSQGCSYVHQYTAVKDNNTTIVSTSDDYSWMEQSVACTIIDDGNGVEITLGHRESIYLAYHEEEQLLAALLANREDELRLLYVDKKLDI